MFFFPSTDNDASIQKWQLPEPHTVSFMTKFQALVIDLICFWFWRTSSNNNEDKKQEGLFLQKLGINHSDYHNRNYTQGQLFAYLKITGKK